MMWTGRKSIMKYSIQTLVNKVINLQEVSTLRHCHLIGNLFKKELVDRPGMIDTNRHPKRHHLFFVTVRH